MAKQYRLRRSIKTFNVVENQAESIELPRGYDYESLTFRLNGTVTVTVAGAAVRAEAPTQLIQRIEVSSNGSQNHAVVPFWAAVFGHFDLGTGQHTPADLVVAPTAAAIAAYPVSATGKINFNTPDGERPKDSNLVTMDKSLLTLRLVFGNAASLFTGAATASFAGTVEVIASEVVELPDAATGKRTMPPMLRKITTIESVVSATTQAHELLLPAGNLVKSVLIRAEGGTTAGEPSDAIVNMLTLASGNDYRTQVKGPICQGDNLLDYSFTRPGMYVLDLTRSGPGAARLSELWDLTQQAQPKLIADVTLGAATTKLQAIVTEYVLLGNGG